MQPSHTRSTQSPPGMAQEPRRPVAITWPSHRLGLATATSHAEHSPFTGAVPLSPQHTPPRTRAHNLHAHRPPIYALLPSMFGARAQSTTPDLGGGCERAPPSCEEATASPPPRHRLRKRRGRARDLAIRCKSGAANPPPRHSPQRSQSGRNQEQPTTSVTQVTPTGPPAARNQPSTVAARRATQGGHVRAMRCTQPARGAAPAAAAIRPLSTTAAALSSPERP